MINAGCGYLRNEFEPFVQRLIELNRENRHSYVTADDLLLKTNRLPSIISSEAKGSKEHLCILMNKIMDNKTTLRDCEGEMISLVNKYITSSQELSRNGRNQFAALYAGSDLIVMHGQIYLNKVFIADYSEFPAAGTFMWSTASLTLFTEDLLNLK